MPDRRALSVLPRYRQAISWIPPHELCPLSKINVSSLPEKEKGTTEDRMVGWHRQLKGRESEQTLGDGEGQGSLARCSPWGRRV